MLNRQRGLSFGTFLMLSIVLVVAAITVLKVVPTYVEYFTVKKAIERTVKEYGAQPPAAIKEGFMRQASVDNIRDISASELQVTQVSSGTTISLSYERVVPVVGNMSLLFAFEIQKSNTQQAAGN
ncbi:DUF4845 domain-containing protein [Janthinobacterium sp. B9-8]|uniref:DUF4845 domain-containing protein n=1 Tax=Janthinobacterium sp. B9-8 TaxID=1236179 RepID=UPI00061CF6DD|nr:DUF4845 domain-containing protein [Janthinobacterium sp. B9-8]AMC33985.1 hypothetical protein VN23_04940 [Janthinobacterium sp. B9-8]